MALLLTFALFIPILATWALRNTSCWWLPGGGLVAAGFVVLALGDKPSEHHGDALDAFDGIGAAITVGAFLGLVLYGVICLLLVRWYRRQPKRPTLPEARVSSQGRHE